MGESTPAAEPGWTLNLTSSNAVRDVDVHGDSNRNQNQPKRKEKIVCFGLPKQRLLDIFLSNGVFFLSGLPMILLTQQISYWGGNKSASCFGGVSQYGGMLIFGMCYGLVYLLFSRFGWLGINKRGEVPRRIEAVGIGREAEESHQVAQSVIQRESVNGPPARHSDRDSNTNGTTTCCSSFVDVLARGVGKIFFPIQKAILTGDYTLSELDLHLEMMRIQEMVAAWRGGGQNHDTNEHVEMNGADVETSRESDSSISGINTSRSVNAQLILFESVDPRGLRKSMRKHNWTDVEVKVMKPNRTVTKQAGKLVFHITPMATTKSIGNTNSNGSHEANNDAAANNEFSTPISAATKRHLISRHLVKYIVPIAMFDLICCWSNIFGIIVGSGLFVVLFSFVTVSAALIRWKWLNRNLPLMQWIAIICITAGMIASSVDQFQEALHGFDIVYFIAIISVLLAAFADAVMYVVSENLFNPPKPKFKILVDTESDVENTSEVSVGAGDSGGAGGGGCPVASSNEEFNSDSRDGGGSGDSASPASNGVGGVTLTNDTNAHSIISLRSDNVANPYSANSRAQPLLGGDTVSADRHNESILSEVSTDASSTHGMTITTGSGRVEDGKVVVSPAGKSSKVGVEGAESGVVREIRGEHVTVTQNASLTINNRNSTLNQLKSIDLRPLIRISSHDCTVLVGMINLSIILLYLIIFLSLGFGQKYIVEPIDEAGGHFMGVFILWVLTAFSNWSHYWAFYRSVISGSAVIAGVNKCVQSVAVFGLSHWLWCDTHAEQCMSVPKTISLVVVLCGVMLFTLASGTGKKE